MVKRFKGRSFLRMDDFGREDLLAILDLADELKVERKSGTLRDTHRGKTLALLFQKPSLRTRVSFDVGFKELGGDTLYLGPDEVGVGKRESVRDVAEVLSRYVHAIEARVFGHEIVETMAEYADVPVINGLSDLTHPCQGLADFQTIRERLGRLQGVRLSYISDGNNVAHSLMLGGAIFGMDVTVASPEGYEPDEGIVADAEALAKKNGGKVTVINDPHAAAEGADVLYADVWASMGQEERAEEKKKDFDGFTIDMEKVKLVGPDAIVLHCLPAHYGEEITEEVMRIPESAIFDQAENRLHAQKALMALLV
ncbi:MAG: ornithine carbamoyltransferase [bacterium]|nr:ornithine carbamoyltransferase [bacterium]